MLLITISILLVSATFVLGDNITVLESPRYTNFGYWGEFETCADGLLVTGFQLKVESYRRRRDNTALNAVKLFCGNSAFKSAQEISSYRGPFGRYYKPHYCSTYAVGFQLNSQAYQGRNGDDVAAVNFQLICADKKQLLGFKEQNGYEYRNSSWTGPQSCQDGMGICGIQTQVEFHQGWGDDTALNNVRVKCCDVPLAPVTSSPAVESTTEENETSGESGSEEVVTEVPDTVNATESQNSSTTEPQVSSTTDSDLIDENSSTTESQNSSTTESQNSSTTDSDLINENSSTIESQDSSSTESQNLSTTDSELIDDVTSSTSIQPPAEEISSSTISEESEIEIGNGTSSSTISNDESTTTSPPLLEEGTSTVIIVEESTTGEELTTTGQEQSTMETNSTSTEMTTNSEGVENSSVSSTSGSGPEDAVTTSSPPENNSDNSVGDVSSTESPMFSDNDATTVISTSTELSDSEEKETTTSSSSTGI